MTAGAPLKFDSANEILKLGEKYFTKQDNADKPYTITGLAAALDTFRDVLIDYENGTYDEIDPQFSNAIKKLKQRVEEKNEEYLQTGNTAGAIFSLINQTRHKGDKGWKNAQHQELTGPNNAPLTFKLLKSDEGM